MLPSPDTWLLAAYGHSIPILLRCLVAASYNEIPLPSCGTKITYENGKLVIPDNPIIPFIEGDGTGRDIWKASVRVFDAASQICQRVWSCPPSLTRTPILRGKIARKPRKPCAGNCATRERRHP